MKVNKLAVTLLLLLSAFTASHGQTTEWKDFVSTEFKFKVKFPGTPDVTTEKASAAMGGGFVNSFAADLPGQSYIVMINDDPDSSPNQSEDLLRAKYKSGVSMVTIGRTLISEREIRLGGILGHEVVVTDGEYIATSRMYGTNQKLFQTIAVTRKSVSKDPMVLDNVARFLDSFKLN